MICDLGLRGESPLLRPAGVDRRFAYRPGTDGLVSASLPDGRRVCAQDEPFVIQRGRLGSAYSMKPMKR